MEKRPRINPELAARIDLARDLAPFEPYVNRALDLYVASVAENDLGALFDELIQRFPAREILHHLFMEGYGFDWNRLKPDLDAEHAEWVDVLDEAALEQEHTE